MHSKHSLEISLAGPAGVFICLLALASAGCGQSSSSSPQSSPPTGGNINNTLRVSTTNPDYFTDNTGKAIYLTGAWGHADLESGFDFNAYLSWLSAEGHNFIRGYHEEEVAPFPYAPASSNPSKVDLTQFNASFFTTLHAEALAAQNAGIYFSMMLFNGWSVNTPGCPAGADPTYNGWATNPYNAANNVNGINGDPNNAGCGTAIHTLNDSTITSLEDAYAVHLVTTMNDLNNLIWEICNECATDSTAFQERYIALIRATEAALPRQHPIWFSVEWPGGSNADLFSSAANVVAPNDSSGNYLGENNGPNATPPPMVMPDSDHLAAPCTLTPDWVWRLFTRGMGGIVEVDSNLDQTANPADASSACGSVNQAMAQARTLANQSNLIALTPQAGLSSTEYCLAHSGQEYLVYYPTGGTVNVDLSGNSNQFSATWLNTSTGAIQPGSGTVAGGGIAALSPPASFNNAPAVLDLVKQ
jgi:hypothetical protein